MRNVTVSEHHSMSCKHSKFSQWKYQKNSVWFICHPFIKIQKFSEARNISHSFSMALKIESREIVTSRDTQVGNNKSGTIDVEESCGRVEDTRIVSKSSGREAIMSGRRPPCQGEGQHVRVKAIVSGRRPTAQVRWMKSVSLAQETRACCFCLQEIHLFHLNTQSSIQLTELETFALRESFLARHHPDEPSLKLHPVFFRGFLPPRYRVNTKRLWFSSF